MNAEHGPLVAQEHGGALAAFAPSPHRDAAKSAWLAALRVTGTVRGACDVTGLSRSMPYEWRQHDPAFSDAWDATIEDVADGIEGELIHRAYNERGMPGVVAGLAVSKRFRPHLWHDRGQEATAINVQVNIALPTAQALDAIRAARAIDAAPETPSIEGTADGA